MSHRKSDPLHQPHPAHAAKAHPPRAALESSGVPRYLARPRPEAEQEADAAASAWRTGGSAPLTPLSGPPSPFAYGIAAAATSGRPLDATWRAKAEQRYDINARDVRLHDDSAAASLASALGANAVTVGNDVFFGEGRYAPSTVEGERILAHELAHVAQQQGEPRAVQCDLGMSLPVPLGTFDVDLVAQAAAAAGASAGMMGTIGFDPDPTGPYSAEIGLVQAVNVTDVGGTTSAPGDPVDWANIPGGHPESERNELMTDGSGVAPAGWFIDSRTANARGTSVGPNYIEHFIGAEPLNQFGYLRSPTDVRRASLWDFPQAPVDVDFDFETVAKGTDNQAIYGSLFWGFGVRSGAVPPTSEYAFAQGHASATFEEALERYRGFFVHEPIVLYFDNNQDLPIAGEEGKLGDIPDYLSRYPDVRVSIDGWADLRGGEVANQDLAQRRADAVQTLLLTMGVEQGRIDWCFGMGETDQFSQHGAPAAAAQELDAGLLRANRRVVVSFQHSVSGHPIVMP